MLPQTKSQVAGVGVHLGGVPPSKVDVLGLMDGGFATSGGLRSETGRRRRNHLRMSGDRPVGLDQEPACPVDLLFRLVGGASLGPVMSA